MIEYTNNLVQTIKEAKVILQNHYDWTESKIGWVCAKCSEE